MLVKALTNSGGSGGNSTPEPATFTISYGTPVVLNFDESHNEFIAIKNDDAYTINYFIISDGIKDTGAQGAYNNWRSGGTAGDDGGYAWSNNNKTLTLTMPRNYYAGTYNLIAM